MSVARRIPALLALLLLGAHFLRFGHLVLVGLCLLLLVPLFVARPSAQTGVRWVLVLAAGLWGWTVAQEVHQRLVLGEPWIRLVAILSAVIAFTLWAAWLLRARPLA